MERLRHGGREFFDFSEASSFAIYQGIGAEFIATALFLFLGIACTISLNYDEITVSLAIGFLVSSLVLGFGHISGCQMNPAVTIALMCFGEMSFIKGIAFIVAQLVGALVGSMLIRRFLDYKIGSGIMVGLLTTLKNSQFNPGHAIFIEMMLTLLLVLVYLSANDIFRPGTKSTAAIAVGLAVTTGKLAGLRFTGAGMNPARAIGPAFVHSNFDDLYVYIVGPILGAFLAVLIYKVALGMFGPRSRNGDRFYYEEYF